MNRFLADDPSLCDRVRDALHLDGYAIIEGAIAADEVSRLREEIQPHLEVAGPDADNPFMGGHTTRFGRLLHRVPATRQLVRHPLVLRTLDATLLRFSPTYQLHFTSVMHVMRGEKQQVLHRDISPFPNPNPTVVIATMWAINDFKRHNGATVFVPGSHLWPDDRVPDPSELRVAEMPAGSVLIYAGNLIHGAGACTEGYRTGVSLQYCVGWMRQEENQYLAVPLDEAKTFDPDLQRLMGYDLAARHWGYVDQQHPMNFLNQTSEYGGLDPAGYEFPNRIEALYCRTDGLHQEHRYPIVLPP